MAHDIPMEKALGATTPDPDKVEIARRLSDQYRGRWMVMWSWCSERFLAWPTWFGGGGEFLQSTDPHQLERLMVEQEQMLGIRPRQRAGAPGKA